MIKLFFRLLLVVAAVTVVYLVFKYQPQINFPISEDRSALINSQTNGLNIWHDRIGSYALIVFDEQLEIFTQPNREKSLAQILSEEQAKFVTNAGYYYFDRNQLYFSGLLLKNGEQISQINTVSTNQISHVLFWQNEKLDVLIAETASSQVSNWQAGGFNALQSGPLLIKNNQIQTSFIQKSDNANGRYLRTVVGQLLSGEKFIWIQKVPQTLLQLTEDIQEHEQLKGKIDFALNLDGGSSTSLIVKNYSATDFLTSKSLPSVLLIK